MKLLVFILNKVELLDDLIGVLHDHGIRGATIIDSTGMAKVLLENEDHYFLGSLRAILDPDREESKTILIVLREEQIKIVRKIISEKVGDLSKPNTGILFTVPIDFISGGTI